MNDMAECRRQNIAHLNRIMGQMETLRHYMEQGESCTNINQLATSIAKSFDSLRIKTLEGFITQELLQGEEISSSKFATLRKLLELHKK